MPATSFDEHAQVTPKVDGNPLTKNLPFNALLLFIIVAGCGRKTLLTEFSALPNPATKGDTVKIHIELNEQSQVKLDITDTYGEPVYSFEENELVSGSQEYILPTIILDAGVYFLHLNVHSTESDRDTSLTGKLIIASSGKNYSPNSYLKLQY